MSERWPAVEVLLPHRPPMLLLDRVVGWQDGCVATEVDVVSGASFFRAGHGIPSWIGVEYLGQAAAVCFGLAARGATGDAEGASTPPPEPGMLVASRRYESRVGHFPHGVTLTVRVRPVSPLSGALVRFAGEIARGEDCLARGEVSVYRGAAA